MTEARIFRTGTLRRLTDERFRQHFRALTGVSPLRYQKQLRLQEARQLMLNEPRRGERRRARGIREPVAIQSRVPSAVWCAASARCHAHAAECERRHDEDQSCCSTSMINGARHCGGYDSAHAARMGRPRASTEILEQHEIEFESISTNVEYPTLVG